jgi:hypothetical protein
MKHRNTLAVAVAIGSLAATTASAHADVKAAEKMIGKVLTLLNSHTVKPEWTSTVAQMAELDAPSACFDALTGLAKDAKLYADWAAYEKDAKKDEADKAYLTPAQADGVCKRYETAYLYEYAEAALVAAWQQGDMMKRPMEEQWEADVQRVGIAGEECAKRVDGALAAGIGSDESIESTRYGMPAVKLGDAKATYCQPAIDYAAKRAAEMKAAAEAKQAKTVALYKKAGIKGARLDLFVEYHPMEWWLPGCQSSTTEPKKMKKAKKLFHWLTDSSGYVTVRTYAFKGDKYKITEKTYDSEAKAYRGCR